MRLSLGLYHHLEVSPLQKGREPHIKQVLGSSQPLVQHPSSTPGQGQLHPGVALVVGSVWCVPTNNNRNPNRVSRGRVGHSRWGLTGGRSSTGKGGHGRGEAVGSEFEPRAELLSWEFVDSLQGVHELLKQNIKWNVCVHLHGCFSGFH